MEIGTVNNICFSIGIPIRIMSDCDAETIANILKLYHVLIFKKTSIKL